LQKISRYSQELIRYLCVVVAIIQISAIESCKKQDSFEAAIAKHRGTLVDQVNISRSGLPYFSVETLNPTWDSVDSARLVSIPKFKLTDQNGRTVDETIFDGKVSVVGFMFASCDGFCPFLVEGMKSVDKETTGNVQFVAFSVDPESDTPEVLRDYAKKRGLTGKNWLLLTGDKDTIYSLAKKTLASQLFRKPRTDKSFIHSEHLYVIDQKRSLRGILNGTKIAVGTDARLVIGKVREGTAKVY
jgi:protein SCO1